MAAPERRNLSEPARLGSPIERGVAESLARSLRAVADPTRLRLLSMIVRAPDEEVTVGELATALDFAQPTITHHLRILVDEGVLLREQRGKYVWHSIAPDRKAAIIDLLR